MANFINRISHSIDPDLPWLCFTTHPVTGEEVIIENGKKGYQAIELLPNFAKKGIAKDLTIEEKNAKLGVTPDQVQSMTLKSFTGNWA